MFIHFIRRESVYNLDDAVNEWIRTNENKNILDIKYDVLTQEHRHICMITYDYLDSDVKRDYRDCMWAKFVSEKILSDLEFHTNEWLRIHQDRNVLDVRYAYHPYYASYVCMILYRYR